MILDYIEEVRPLEYNHPALFVLSVSQKKCQEDTMAKDIEDIIAIAHDDDLQLFEDIVRTSQETGIYSRSQLVMHSSRKP